MTVLCDSLDDAFQQLIVVDNVQQVERKEVATKHGSQNGHGHKQLQA